ncbi:hypothetical protein [Falsirhodobacter xinxiangensis]|uniref:hypothetical protein n=1 Tax=Falsirhodobacter xinxiangensis TaxID=2530049 RepID=UPI0010AADBE6|nr:hypothetical protein [Rhodobacter xinxiangensis]
MHRDHLNPPLRKDGLQLDEHRDSQLKFWRIQRVAWVFFALIIVGALLGLTGSGGLLQKQSVSLGEVTLKLPRVSRWEAADEISITFGGNVETPSITISQPFFERFGVERIQPEPASTTLTPFGQTFTFDAAGNAERAVQIDIRSLHFGFTRFEIAVGSERRSTSLIILP